MEFDYCMKNIKEAIMRPPSMILHIKNYHWEEKKVQNSRGETSTKKVKVYTGEAREPLPFTDWSDLSPPAESLDYVDVLHITRLFTNKIINMSSKV